MKISRSPTLAGIAAIVLQLLSGIVAADTLSGQVHWDRIKGQISKELFSMNLFSFPITDKVANPRYRDNVRYMKPAILRLHNAGTTKDDGGASLVAQDEKDWNYDKIGAILNHLKDIPGDRMFNIVRFPSWLDTDGDHRLDSDKLDGWSKFCADLVRFTNKTLPDTYIKYWELTNERDRLYGDAGKINQLVAAYNIAHDAMKAVDPTIRVGGPAFERPDITANMKGFVDGTYQKLDFISAHGYACGSSRTPDAEVYDKVTRLVGHMVDVRDYCKAKAGRHIPIYWDEFNVSWTWRSWDGRMKNNKGACFDALCYIEAIKAGLDGLFPWNECDGIYGKMGNEFELRPPAHCINILATHVAGQWVETIDTPTVRMLGVVNEPKRVIIIVNRSNDTHTMALSFTGWLSESTGEMSINGHRIDNSGYNKFAVSYTDIKKGISLPRHSVNVLVMDR